ncbi:MAG: hypothetical protein IPK13_05380 [Deltaproteobacteria bacterium]|nr:hypothetical protein [Deltaproteobacteria bacterium]
MGTTLHQGQTVRSGGASRAEVENMLRNVDADGDGQISARELSALAAQGRARGFADGDALGLFRAGLDASALAEQKSREPGQQFSEDYIDKKMNPFLERSYGRNGRVASELVTPQASKELTSDAASAYQRRAGYDALQTKAIAQHLGPHAKLSDTNKDGRIDAKDRALVPTGNGGYTWHEIGAKKADRINETVGLARGAKILEGRPHFPNSPGNPAWANRGSDGAPRAEWMGGRPGGPWSAEKIPSGKPGAGGTEFKLDQSRMTASEALDDMAKNPKNYCFDCAMAKQVVQYARVREMLGDDKFNALAKKHGMTIGHSDAAYRTGLLAKMTDFAPGGSANMKLEDYKSGWQGYAKVVSVGNPDVMRSLEQNGWSGEHFTVALNEKGEKVVHAHPFGTMPLAEFDAKLRDRLVADSGGRIRREDIQIDYRRPLDSDVDYAREKL